MKRLSLQTCFGISLTLLAVSSCARWNTSGDTDPPDTTIVDRPQAVTFETTQIITFVSSEPGSTFECRLNDEKFEECSSPHTVSDLADQEYVFEVRAVDMDGNRDQSPDSAAFSINTKDARVVFNNKPAENSNELSGQITFKVNREVTFDCSVDTSPAGCPSSTDPNTPGWTYGTFDFNLLEGLHSFQVNATMVGSSDAGKQVSGNHQWFIDATAPVFSSIAPIFTKAVQISVPYQIADLIGLQTVVCTLHGETVPCGEPIGTAPFEFNTPLPGNFAAEISHLFVVTATDKAGNVDDFEHTFTIDRTAPTLSNLDEQTQTIGGMRRHRLSVTVNGGVGWCKYWEQGTEEPTDYNLCSESDGKAEIFLFPDENVGRTWNFSFQGRDEADNRSSSGFPYTDSIYIAPCNSGGSLECLSQI